MTDGNLGFGVGTVSINVKVAGEPPVAVDDSATLAEDGMVSIAVLANDSDADLDPLTVASFTQGSFGTVTDNGDGTLTYTPNADFVGG